MALSEHQRERKLPFVVARRRAAHVARPYPEASEPTSDMHFPRTYGHVHDTRSESEWSGNGHGQENEAEVDDEEWPSHRADGKTPRGNGGSDDAEGPGDGDPRGKISRSHPIVYEDAHGAQPSRFEA